MIRLSTLFWLILVSATGFAMFAVKYEVQALADQLAHTSRQADDAERDVRVLDADWAYLNRPDALAAMNQRYLSLLPIATKQLIASIADIPMRPATATACRGRRSRRRNHAAAGRIAGPERSCRRTIRQLPRPRNNRRPQSRQRRARRRWPPPRFRLGRRHRSRRGRS